MSTIYELTAAPTIGTYFLLTIPCSQTGEQHTVVKLVSHTVSGKNTKGLLGFSYVHWSSGELIETRGCGIHKDTSIFSKILTEREAKEWAPDPSFRSRPKRTLTL